MENKKNIEPPIWPRKVLRWFIRPGYLEEIEGDMEELFHENVQRYSRRRADLIYLLDVILLYRISLVKKINGMNWLQNLSMLQSYLKSGWRSFLKYKTYSLINILGLTVGFTASLVLFIIIQYENSFDRFHDRSDRIYKVGTRWSSGDLDDLIVTPQIPLMEDEYADIVRGSRFFEWEDMLQYEDHFVRSGYHLVDSSFAGMFDFQLIRGNLKEALTGPDRIALTEELANKIFGDQDPLGKTISLVNENQQLVVTAVLTDPPKNSTLQFKALIPWSNAPEALAIDQMGNWYNTFMTGYVELVPGSHPSEVEEKLIAFKQKHFLEERKAGSDIVLLPLHDEHFRGGSGQRILSILGIIALAILLISCINFMNLSISQLLQRTREIGVRKVLGGRPGQLIMQFMSESMIVCLLAGLTGLIGAYFLLPLVAGYFDFGIKVHSLGNLSTLFFITAICFTVAMLSSFWPSVILSGLKVMNLMKDAFDWNKTGGLFRKTLMVLQFTTSIFLIIGTIIIWQQIQFMKNQDLKFDGAHVVAMEYYPELFKSPEEAQKKMSVLRDELIGEPLIESMTIANSVPGKYSHNYNWFEAPDSQEVKGLSLRQLTVDHQFFETFKIKFLTGRNFSQDLESDKNAVVINERAMKELGWKDLEGKSLKAGGDGVSHQVVGVVEDYYYQSLKDQMQPVIHFYHPEASGVVAVRLHPENVTTGLAILKEKWSGLDPYEPFAYTFVDASFDQLYKEHQRLGTTSTFFSVIALVLAGLGLFSLSAYSIRLRRKEIGIRKVLGASIYHVVTILSRNFGLLIILGFIIACPLVYYLMRIFLQDFAYHIPLTPGVFLLGGFFILLIFMGLVGMQSLKAARESPSVSIKDE